MYKIVPGKPVKMGSKFVQVFQVRDETGAVLCQESSEALARSHIESLEESAKADREAQNNASPDTK